MAVLKGSGKIKIPLDEFFNDIESNPLIDILPLTPEIALDVASLGKDLQDPADRAIVATARVHRLRLITSDQRIIESKLIATID